MKIKVGLALIKESKQHISFSLLGEDEIELTNLTDTLNGIAHLCGRINAVTFPDSETSLKIHRTEKGSFTVLAVLAVSIEPNFLNYLNDIASRYLGQNKVSEFMLQQMDSVIGIKLFSGGEPLKKVEEVKDKKIVNYHITNNQGEILIVNQTPAVQDYLTNEEMDKSISDISRNAGTRDGFVFSAPNGSSINISKEDCSSLANPIMRRTVDTNEEIEERKATIYPCMPDLQGNRQWEVMYQGRPVKMKILDEDFLMKTRNGYKIGAKSGLKVLMRVRMYSKGGGEPETVKYEVLEVLE